MDEKIPQIVNKKRSRLEVIYDMLKTISTKPKGIKPTHLLYKSNLSHKMMAEYLRELLSKRLIRENVQGKNKTYHLTSEGTRYLSEYHVMKNFLDSFGLD